MMAKKILFAGCSFTSDCGFNDENIIKYHWPVVVSKHYGFDVVNISIGGMSNDEIFYRTIDSLTKTDCELVVIMWSELSRKWIYCSENNVDDFTIITNGSMGGIRPDSEYVQSYTKLHHVYFDNRYVALKHWLLQIIALQNIFENNDQSFVFIKGFENHILDFLEIDINKDLFMLDKNIKKILDFDSRPDYFIIDKINVIKNLFNKIDKSKWINFDSKAFGDMKVDVADDQIHPGIITNKILSDYLIEHIDKINNCKNVA